MSPAAAPAPLLATLRAQLRRRARRRPRRMPRQQTPTSIQKSYVIELRGYVAVARAAVEKYLLPQLDEILGSRADAFRLDAGSKTSKAAMARARAAFDAAISQTQLERLARDVGARTADFHDEQLTRQVRAALGVDLGSIAAEPAVAQQLEEFVASNVSLIESVSTRYFDQIETNVDLAVRQGWRHEQLSEALQERVGVAESSADLIARDQVLKFYGECNEVRQSGLGVESYFWRGSLDNRERQLHVDREGKEFRWDNPPDETPDDGHPGYPIQCRCTAEPNFEGLLESL
jgi:SPP1 gp7 family putative phage head morphogenesis protein